MWIRLRQWLCALCLPIGVASAQSYEAALPPQLNTAPELCAHAPCRAVLPGADHFSSRMGHPPYVEGYRSEAGKATRIGYVFLSTDIVDIPAYSGKPVVTLIGMDVQGHFTGVRVLKHSEPILLLGIAESALTRFNEQYLGQFVGNRIEIGRSHQDKNVVGIDAITGATVTVIAQNQVMLRAGRAVARQVGIIQPRLRPPARYIDLPEQRDWAGLVKEGAVQRLRVAPQDVGLPKGGAAFIDLWFGALDSPVVGRSVLGERGHADLMASLKPGETPIFVIGSGRESFKGSGFVRGGIFDRIQVSQDGESTTFRDLDYLNLYGIAAKGAPAYTESAIFILRNSAFSAAYPWNLVFIGNRMDQETGARSFASFERRYWTPARYLVGGRPVVETEAPTWLRVWRARALEIGLFCVFLLAVALVYAARDTLVRRSTRHDKRWVSAPKYAAWVISIGFVGFTAMAQPSITQVLTWFHALLFQWQWELFLSDPLIFVFWWFIILTVFLWGRGLFCGWVCPFGSLSELIFKVGERLGLKRWQRSLPLAWHERLKWLKYGIFFALLGVSFYDMTLAEKLAEVEPFKTTFLVGLFNRSWPYTLFAASLLGLSLFIERPFCKYLCPLGAALAMPSTFRWFGLKRKRECGPCKACAVGCGSLAIDAAGHIDQRECLLCLDCMVMYYEPHACPPLAQERKRRDKAGLPPTPIGADGYYIPIKPIP